MSLFILPTDRTTLYPGFMKLNALLALAALAAFTTGCSSLARGGAAGSIAPDAEEDADDFGPIPVTAARPAAGAPGQMDVAWEDNGIPIRQLTGDGGPQEMKVPSSHPKKPLGPAPSK